MQNLEATEKLDEKEIHSPKKKSTTTLLRKSDDQQMADERLGFKSQSDKMV
jgi:hypothetical protein